MSSAPVTSTSGAKGSSIYVATPPTSQHLMLSTSSNSIPRSESPSINCSREVKDIVGKMFPNDDIKKVHHHDLCLEKPGHCNLNAGKFKHEWISLKAKNDGKSKNINSAFDLDAGLWWLIYIEDRGMFCLLCMKHMQGEARLAPFCEKPSVRMRPGTLGDHLSSASHKSSVQVEHTQRVSQFHKLSVQKDQAQDTILKNAFLSAYWLAKEEVANKKFPSLLTLLERAGNHTMKFFMHRSQQSTIEIFHSIGDELRERIVALINKSSAVGLLCDDAMDVSVIEQFIGFLQFYNHGLQNVEVKFLFAEDALKKSDSANSQALYDIVVDQFKAIGLKKLTGLCTDGASVMVGKREGLAAKLKRDCPQMINIHCVCHKLALACVDADQDLKYVDHMATIIRQLWQSMENSSKRTKAYMKTQMQLHSIGLNRKSKKKVFKKLKKACKTRWLSFNNSVASLFEDLPAVMLALSSLPESDAMAYGLLQNIKNAKFIAALYILHSVLPHLAYLSMAFQKGKVNFGHIEPALQCTKDALEELKTGQMLQKLKTDLTLEGKLFKV